MITRQFLLRRFSFLSLFSSTFVVSLLLLSLVRLLLITQTFKQIHSCSLPCRIRNVDWKIFSEHFRMQSKVTRCAIDFHFFYSCKYRQTSHNVANERWSIVEICKRGSKHIKRLSIFHWQVIDAISTRLEEVLVFNWILSDISRLFSGITTMAREVSSWARKRSLKMLSHSTTRLQCLCLKTFSRLLSIAFEFNLISNWLA